MRHVWLARFLLLFSFAAFDFLSTRIYITDIAEESNGLARMLMQTFGMTIGLGLMCLILGLLLGGLVAFCGIIFAKRTDHATLLTLLAIDGFLAWFVAGSHFVGGTSWFWLVPEISRHLLGAGIYFVFLYASFLVPDVRFAFRPKNTEMTV